MGAISAVVVIFILVLVGTFLYWVYHRYKLQHQQEQFMKWAGNVMRERADTNSIDNSPFLHESGKNHDYRKRGRFSGVDADRRSNRSDSTWSESSTDDGLASGSNSGYGSVGSTPAHSRSATPDILQEKGPQIKLESVLIQNLAEPRTAASVLRLNIHA